MMKKNVLGIWILPLALLACGGESAAVDSVSEVAEEVSSLRLYLFDCGRIRLPSVEGFGLTDEETGVRELAVPCYMVEHELGRLLWDGGLPSTVAAAGDWVDQGAMQLRLDRTLEDQLADLGLGMSDFDYVAFSHLHFDHVGVANEIESGMLLIQRTEFEAGFSRDVTTPGFDPSLYSELESRRRRRLDGDFDVFGDGRVRILSAPGHTPGHQALLVDLASGPVLLSGDLYHFRFSYENRRVPEFNVDRDATLASMDKIEEVLEETGAELWIEHELAAFEALAKSPAYHE